MSKVNRNARYDEILNPSLSARLHAVFLWLKRSFSIEGMIPGCPVTDELIIQAMEEEIRHVEPSMCDSADATDVPENQRNLHILDAQISACERAIDEAVSLRKRDALRHALHVKACFEMRRAALTTK